MQKFRRVVHHSIDELPFHLQTDPAAIHLLRYPNGASAFEDLLLIK